MGLAVDTMLSTTQVSISPDAMLVIRETSYGGRGAFAPSDLAAGTPILNTDLIPAHVILTEYKKEVCARCFKYDRGRTLKSKDIKASLYFCSSVCQIEWRVGSSQLGIEAWEALASFLQRKSKAGGGGGKTAAKDGKEADETPPEVPARPSAESIAKAWEAVEATAHFVRQARLGSTKKPHRISLQAAVGLPPSHKHLSHLLSGCLTKATDENLWAKILQLAPDATPYRSLEDLESHVQAYLQLIATMPVALLDAITTETCHEVVCRDSHNAFGIRSLDDGGDEFFGFGVWPEASYFNHSCEPSISKKRVAREWQFWLNRGVKEGEELTISYLGGDEKQMALLERRQRLQENWAFECGCTRCQREGENGSSGASIGGVPPGSA